MSQLIDVSIYETSVKISAMEFCIMRKFMNEVTYTWSSRRKIHLPNHEPPDWGLYFLASHPILEYLKTGEVEIHAKHSKTIEFFEEFLELLLTILGSEKFKSIDPRQALNMKAPINTIRIYYYPKFSRVHNASTYYKKSKDCEELSIRIDFKDFGLGHAMYSSKKGLSLLAMFTSKRKVEIATSSLDSKEIITETKRTLKNFVKAHAAVHIAYKYMNI